MLSLENLHASYGRIQILHGVSIKVPRAKIVCIIGANGSGKSTIFKTIFGLLKVDDSSRIMFNDKNLANWKPEKIVREGISYVPQSRSIFRNLTVEENLEMGAYIRTDSAVRSDIERLYDMFQVLKTRRKVNAANLSGGEQQMLVMARALLLNPQLVLLDEPSLGLEPRFAELIFAKIKEINQDGKAILIIEQNARRALEMADYAYVLDLGKVRFEGPPQEIMDNQEVQRLYLGG